MTILETFSNSAIPTDMPESSCIISIESFDGPLDLLLFLIRRDELDIYDIPVSHVAGQYLIYIRHAQDLNLDIASEYLVMAATLTKMKSKSLLPTSRFATDDEEDSAAVLGRQLILYKAFRKIAGHLRTSEDTWRDVFSSPGERKRWSSETVSLEPGQTTLFELIEALNALTSDEEVQEGQKFKRRIFTIAECIKALESLIHSDRNIDFREILGPTPDKSRVISYFISILELIRRGWVSSSQKYPFGTISIRKTKRWTIES